MNDAPVESGALLRAVGLGKTYPDGEVHALRGVSLEVREHEAVAIVEDRLAKLHRAVTS